MEDVPAKVPLRMIYQYQKKEMQTLIRYVSQYHYVENQALACEKYHVRGWHGNLGENKKRKPRSELLRQKKLEIYSPMPLTVSESF